MNEAMDIVAGRQRHRLARITRAGTSLSALGQEKNLAQPVIRLWDETRYVET